MTALPVKDTGLRALLWDRPFFQGLWRLSLPLAATNLTYTLVSLADNLMVGQLGEVALSGVSLANQMQFLLLLACFGLGSGAAVFTAQYWGTRDQAGVLRTQGFATLASLTLGLGFWLASQLAPEVLLGLYTPVPEVQAAGAAYLRAAGWSFPLTAVSASLALVLRSVGEPRLPLQAALGALGLNVTLNGVLIFGLFGVPALGVVGAAWATVGARLLELILLITGMIRRRSPNWGPLRAYLHFPRGFFSRYLHTAGPVLANEVVWSLGITALQALYARLGSAASASAAVLDLAAQITFVLFMGTGSAAAIQVGQALGAGRPAEARRLGDRYAWFSPLAGLLVGLWLIPGGWLMPLAFDLSPEARQTVTWLFWILAGVMPFKSAMHHLIIGVFRGGGDTRFALMLDLIGLWAVAVPLAALGVWVWGLPLPAIYALVVCEEIVKSALGWRRMAGGRWLHRVIEAEPLEERLGVP